MTTTGEIFRDIRPPQAPIYEVFGRKPARYDPHFALDERMTSAAESIAPIVKHNYDRLAQGHNVDEMFAWGLYGPPNPRREAFIQQIAAALYLPYVEVPLTADMNANDLIAYRALHDNGKNGFVTGVTFGPVGAPLLLGSVVCVKEVTALPAGAQPAFLQLTERCIRSFAPESSPQAFPLHPASLLFFTWTIAEGRPEHPYPSLLSRLLTHEV